MAHQHSRLWDSCFTLVTPPVAKVNPYRRPVLDLLALFRPVWLLLAIGYVFSDRMWQNLNSWPWGISPIQFLMSWKSNFFLVNAQSHYSNWFPAWIKTRPSDQYQTYELGLLLVISQIMGQHPRCCPSLGNIIYLEVAGDVNGVDDPSMWLRLLWCQKNLA